MLASDQQQPDLLADTRERTVYEQPLNERMRTILRLEHLFGAARARINDGSQWDARSAIVHLIEINDLLGRADIKGELIKEIERHMGVFSGLRNNPSVEPGALEEALSSLQPLVYQLKTMSCQPGNVLRHDELINQVKQRAAIPGGMCSFDLPGLHYWLHQAPHTRRAQFLDWLADLEIIESAVNTILQFVRDSTEPQLTIAPKGFFQQQLDQASGYQLVRVMMIPSDALFPEISGGKHRFVIRFLAQNDTAARPQIIEHDVEFELQCCVM